MSSLSPHHYLILVFIWHSYSIIANHDYHLPILIIIMNTITLIIMVVIIIIIIITTINIITIIGIIIIIIIIIVIMSITLCIDTKQGYFFINATLYSYFRFAPHFFSSYLELPLIK